MPKINFTDNVTLSTSTRTITDEGYLLCIADTCRTGIMEYTAEQVGIEDMDPNAIVNVYRSPEEVFSPAAMNSFKGKPVTLSHPGIMLDASNIRDYTVGHGGDDVKRAGNSMKQNLYVTDAVVIKMIQDGEVDQISNGYQADIVIKDGVTPDGIKFHAEQKNIRGNHIAILKNGRAGKGCRINDSQDTPNTNNGGNMPKMKFNDVEIDVTEQSKQAIELCLKNIKTLEDGAVAHEGVVASLNDEHKVIISKLEGERDEALSKVLTDEQIQVKIATRTALVADAKLIDKDFVEDAKLSNEAIVKSVICKDNKDLEKKDASYLQARFDVKLEDAKEGSKQESNKQKFVDAAGNDQRSDSEKARDKFTEDAESLYNKED